MDEMSCGFPQPRHGRPCAKEPTWGGSQSFGGGEAGLKVAPIFFRIRERARVGTAVGSRTPEPSVIGWAQGNDVRESRFLKDAKARRGTDLFGEKRSLWLLVHVLANRQRISKKSPQDEFGLRDVICYGYSRQFARHSC
jgi:hypothetical protein